MSEKKLSSVCKPTNYRILLHKSQAHALAHLCLSNGSKVQVSERLTFSVIKTIVPCVEGDRSDSGSSACLGLTI